MLTPVPAIVLHGRLHPLSLTPSQCCVTRWKLNVVRSLSFPVHPIYCLKANKFATVLFRAFAWTMAEAAVVLRSPQAIHLNAADATAGRLPEDNNENAIHHS